MRPRFLQVICLAALAWASVSVSGGEVVPAEVVPRAKPAAEAPEAPAKAGPPAPAKRRVYVLHGGVHTIMSHPNKNIFAETMRDQLKKRGIADRDIVGLESCYPTAHWYNMFPRECVTTFMASSKPDTKVAQDAYARMDKALKQLNVGDNDELVLVGHSAGGQMCLTLAYLATNHAAHAELSKSTRPYRVDMVVTLGAPIASNPLAADVKVRHYLSPRDGLPRRLARISPPLLWVMGYDTPINVVPTKPSPTCKVRMFLDVEHPNWDTEDRVVDRIIAESNPVYCPAWQLGMCYPCLRLSPVQFMCQALDAHCHITIEDPPRPRK